MTSNERKIINFLRDAKEKTHIRLIAKKTNFSSDYTQSLCRSLARAGYIKLEDSNVCHLLKKGQGHFESVAVMREVSEPMAVTAHVTLLTDELAGTPLASDYDDKADDDAGLNKALADLEPLSKKEEGEKIDEPEASGKTESVEEAEGKEEQREEEILAEPAIEIEEEKTESSGAATEPKEEAAEKEEAIELEPQATAESAEAKEEVKAEVQGTGATETKPADNPAPAVPLESSEATAMKKEEKQEKEDVVKPNSDSGWSFKKIVNWFAEKK